MDNPKDRTVQVIRDYLKGEQVEAASLAENELLDQKLSDFDMDSLQTMEMVMNLEEEFDIMMDEDDVLSCNKISDFVVLIEKTVLAVKCTD